MTTTAEIWGAFHDRLRGFVARRIRREGDREDVLQDIFMKIHAGLPGLADEAKLEAWLFGVARRAVVDHFRKRRSGALPPEPAAEPLAEDPSKEVASWLRPMMESLPIPDREALELADVAGLEQGAVAERLGLSLSGAKSRIQRARLKLKDVLQQCCEIELDRRGNPVAYAPKAASCSCDSCG